MWNSYTSKTAPVKTKTVDFPIQFSEDTALEPSWNPAGVEPGNQEGPGCGARGDGALERAVAARALSASEQ